MRAWDWLIWLVGLQMTLDMIPRLVDGSITVKPDFLRLLLITKAE